MAHHCYFCLKLSLAPIFSVRNNVLMVAMAWDAARLATASTEELAILWTDLAPVLTDGAEGNANNDPARIRQLMDHSALTSVLVMQITLICKFILNLTTFY